MMIIPFPTTFKFMTHDKWANVLFLHWRIPTELEDVLKEATAPFILDRYDDGSAWIGLVLLTEQNVGPSFLRSSRTCVTHHGVNVRTYVRGVDDDGDASTTNNKQRGIHFSSLECDVEFTAYGANLFGMPYKMATISRQYGLVKEQKETLEDGNENENDGEYDNGEYGDDNDEEEKFASSLETAATNPDSFVCAETISGGGDGVRTQSFELSSTRLSSSTPSLYRLFFSLLAGLSGTKRLLHSTSVIEAKPTSTSNGYDDDDDDDDAINKESPKVDSKEGPTPCGGSTFSVQCSWERFSRKQQQSSSDEYDDTTNKSEVEQDPAAFARWLVERYFVYTNKYGLNWRGQVEHGPWEVERVKLNDLKILNVDRYEPKGMQPILRFMASTPPESVLFSPGVGPIEFHMLRPV